LSFNVLDEANVSMNIIYPERITFEEKNNISISLSRESSNIPQNANLKIITELMEQEWNFENLDERKGFILEFQGKNLKNGENKIIVSLEYYDELGKKQTQIEEFEVELYNLTFFQKIYVWFNGLIVTL
jgi:hypothetical protein